MKRLLFTVLTFASAMICVLIFPAADGRCRESQCCEKCRKLYSACTDAYEKQLFSRCHATCGSSHPRDKEGFSACLDGCYLEMEKLIESEGCPACDSQFGSCGEKCGGCGD